MSKELLPIMLYFIGREILRLACPAVVLVVVVKTKEGKIVVVIVLRVSVEVSDLPLLFRGISVEPVANAAPPTA